MSRVLVEIAVTGLLDGLAAARAGADRLEVSSALSVGGVSPSLGLVKSLIRETGLPVVVLLRARPGGFETDRDDLRVMLADAEAYSAAGAEGLAFGFTRDGRIDQEACAAVRKVMGQAKAVFHRAFDRLVDPTAALDELVDLGFHRVLTSGGPPTALLGIDTLRRLVEKAAGRLDIVAAGGVRVGNAQALLAAGMRQLHASCKAPYLSAGGLVGQEDPERVDLAQVADLVRVVWEANGAVE
jgi:copper homeostasis protein